MPIAPPFPLQGTTSVCGRVGKAMVPVTSCPFRQRDHLLGFSPTFQLPNESF
ncbi:hypothetical protein DY000_02009620 [Brassica cretica]|uniref:Uncharacterized protein n=1 Tax=Brassica cretica TaxID=69181 RepID=A0ABQ7CD14_BRACR|nr:hypothetical protein DY000_02009620 [Brassica cretica]